MLQRIQTVFLLLVVILMATSMFFPIWIYNADDSEIFMKLSSLHLEQNVIDTETNALALTKVYFPYSIIAILAICAIIVTSIEISKFNNRILQIKLGALSSLFMAGTMGLSAYFATDLMEASSVGGNFSLGIFLPAGAMFCNIIANRFIRKDERLVRSVDRIR